MMNAIAHLRPDSSESPDDRALLLAAVEAFPASLAIVASGVIVYANPACCEMFEYGDASQLQGRSVEDLIPTHSLTIVPSAAPGDPTRDEPTGDGPPETEPKINTGMHSVRNRWEGARRHLEVSRASFRLGSGEFQVIHARDVSRQEQAEKQLQEAQAFGAVGRLVGGVAHDFNNLLTGIMLYCDLLIGELEEDSRPHRHAREMRAAGEHGAAMVRQLLALARPSSEPSHLFALNDAVTSIEDLLTRLIGENIDLSTSLASDLAAVRMDPAQVQQILLNLVLNARDAMPGGGRITLTTRNGSDDLASGLAGQTPTAPWVELTVADTGCGMESETLNRAFEPFFTSKTPGRGNGLGLATARRLAEQEGGSITAQSQPGKGTRVSLRLPRAQSDTPSNSKVER